MRFGPVATLAASVLLAASGVAAPAAAEPSPTACDDVTVIVDYNELGGDTRTGCVAPGTAAEVFDAAGFGLEYVPQMGDFVCRVTGVPADGPCTDGDSYWSLWWSDGTNDWTYATFGVNSLEIAAGGYVGFAWHEGAGDAEPPDGAQPAAGGCPDWPACDSDDAGADPTASDDDPSDEEDDPSDEEGTFPLWAVVLVAGVVLGLGVVPFLRRRRS